MKFPSFDLERIQSIYENSVEINLTESGIEPLSLKELMNPKELEELLNLPLGYGYTQGTPLLRQRISNLYEGADENNVLVTSGSSEAIFLSAVLTVSKGDRVVMMTPNYLSFNGVAEALGADVDYVPLLKKEKWEWDLDCLNEVVSNKTKVISVCNPNNPPGSVLNALFGGLTAGPMGAVAYGLGDFLLNTPAIALARGIRPGVKGDLVNKAGKVIKKGLYQPSALETGVNIGASVASYPLVDLVTRGSLYQDRSIPTQLTEQYYYPGVDLPPEVLRRLQQEGQ